MTLLLAAGILLGIFLGLLSATVTESLGHKFTGHPGPALRRLYLRHPRLFFPFLRPLYQHLVIHHHKTFTGRFFDQFDSARHKLEVDAWIAMKFPSDFSALIWREKYNLTLRGVTGVLPFAIPFCVGPLLIFLTLGPVAFWGSLMTAFIPVWLSKYVHPLIHLPEDVARAHPFVRWLMRTGYMRRVFRNHYLHHQHLGTNFNLLLGGDYLVFLHRRATAKEEEELELLLLEFDRRVRQEQSAVSRGAASPAISKTDFLKGEREYLALVHPDFEQRFAYQAWKAMALGNGTDLMLNEGRRDFGMKVYDKGITLEGWGEQENFSLESYESRDGRVAYRGVEFQTGDILLTNQQSDSDGLFSTLLEGEINFSHVAIFAVLPWRGKQLPAVIEMNEYGARAVPLKAFLSDRFNSYVEVFRWREPLSNPAKEKIASAAYGIMAENHGFDIYQDAGQDYYLNCARTVAEICKRAGLAVPEAGSRYHPGTHRNLTILGIEASAGRALMMPDDYARWSELGMVGVVDNGCFDDVLARALVRDRIQEIWRTEVLDRGRFPFKYHVNEFVIRGIQEKTWYSPLLLKLAGMKRAHFPSGPLVFLSLAPIGNTQMEAATRRLRQDLKAHMERLRLLGSWRSLREDPQIRTLVLEASRSYLELYRKSQQHFELQLAAEIER
jgi:hypothetical protein